MCGSYVRQVLEQQQGLVASLDTGGKKRGREELPVHPAVAEATPLVHSFRAAFGAAWDKLVKAEKLDLSIFDHS